MTIAYEDGRVVVHHSDCIEAMRTIADSSVDAIVTDPPYGLGFMGHAWDQPGEFGALRGNGTPGLHGRVGKYDHTRTTLRAGAMEAGRYDQSAAANQRFQAWCEAWAREALRVLKPGGHLLSFGGTRTYHRLASGLEDAGFEIRDCLTWLYGSGFPKSLDVAKAIDKRRDDEAEIRAVCRFLRASIEASPLTVADIAERFDFHSRMVEHWAARDTDSQPALPTLEQWDALRDLLGFDDSIDGEVLRLNLRKGEPGEAWKDRPITGTVAEWQDRTNYALTSRDGLRRDVPSSEEAKQWDGWGTALKPAFEPIVMARKPLVGTVAANVLQHGTGALNIDGCRISTTDDTGRTRTTALGRMNDDGWEPQTQDSAGNPLGRWPANVALDEVAAAQLDAQTGVLTSGLMRAGTRREGIGYSGGLGCEVSNDSYGDAGGASRFMYVAKASRADRDQGNTHPTVKPIDLMRWLVRLVTPPDGIVLDPFGGSGTTAVACVVESRRCVLIEREAEYVEIIRRRLAEPRQIVLGVA